MEHFARRAGHTAGGQPLYEVDCPVCIFSSKQGIQEGLSFQKRWADCLSVYFRLQIGDSILAFIEGSIVFAFPPAEGDTGGHFKSDCSRYFRPKRRCCGGHSA
jgi:hypothetical protein